MQNETMLSIPDSQNKAAGFWGAIHPYTDAATAWPMVFSAIAEETEEATCADAEDVCRFLDSRFGRHLADEVIGQMQRFHLSLAEAIDAAIAKWMRWKIKRRLETETGLLRGQPYLFGLIGLCRTFYALEGEETC